jgi:hypothetical protein
MANKVIKLLSGLLLLTMSWMCSSSSGYVLVYNVSIAANVVNNTTKATIPLKGYLICSINDSNEFQDVNLILYGKDSNNPANQKVYVQLNNSDSNEFLRMNTWQQGDYTFLDLWSYSINGSPFDFEILMMGKVGSIDVGLGTNSKKPVVGKLKGAFMAWKGMLLGLDQNVAGTSNISAALWPALTRTSNAPLTTWTQEEVVEGKMIDGKEQGIKPVLKAKHYEKVNLPEP